MNRVTAAVMRWIVVACYCMMIVTIPGGSVLPSGLQRVFGMDKLIHFAVYAVLCFLICRALTATAGRTLGRWMLVLALVLTVGYGIFDEVRQIYVPNRDANVFDAVADGIGALCTVLVWPKVTARWRVLMR